MRISVCTMSASETSVDLVSLLIGNAGPDREWSAINAGERNYPTFPTFICFLPSLPAHLLYFVPPSLLSSYVPIFLPSYLPSFHYYF